MGVKNIGLFERVIVGIHLFIAHVARFFSSLEDIGGPFIFLLGFLGTVYLKKKDLFTEIFNLVDRWFRFIIFFRGDCRKKPFGGFWLGDCAFSRSRCWVYF